MDLLARRTNAENRTANRKADNADNRLLLYVSKDRGIHGVFVGYSRDIRMYRLCVGYVSVMYRLCVGRYSEHLGRETIEKKGTTTETTLCHGKRGTICTTKIADY